MKVNRRRFLLYGAAGAAAVGAAYAGGWWWFKVRRGDTEDMIVSILKRHLAGLPVAEEDMRAFARHLQPRFARHRRLAMLGMLGPIYERVDVISWVPGSQPGFRRIEDAVVGEFLLSTDYFDEDADTSEGITYIGPYDAYARICGNPFARLEEESRG